VPVKTARTLAVLSVVSNLAIVPVGGNICSPYPVPEELEAATVVRVQDAETPPAEN
jgi:hypothetical protein